jgi:chromosome segregation ATPase
MYEAADEIERLRGVRDDVNRDNERLVRELAKAADEIERLTGLFDKWHTIAAEQREEIKQLKEEKGSGCKP